MTQIDEQTLRDIFNSNGLNYSQIVGDELTTVSMELQDFNYSLEQILALISTQVQEARIEAFDIAFDCHDYDRLRAYRAALKGDDK